MRNRFSGVVISLAIAVLVAISPAAGETPKISRIRQTASGKPDLNGIWQALGTAHWDIEAHAARSGPLVALGAAGAVPAGLGMVEGGQIPYQPWAAAKKKENAKNWLTADPEIKCYHARCAPRHLHALPVSNRADAEAHPDDLRICRRQPCDPHG